MSKINQTNPRRCVSVVVPVYNESAFLPDHIEEIITHLTARENRYDWEIIAIDDGSTDSSGKVLDGIAKRQPNVHVLHHLHNLGLGHALRFGFSNTSGDFVVVLDVDLSYGVEHIDELLDAADQTNARIVLTSPYMRGGSISNVPWMRRILSSWGNRFLGFFAKGHFSTLTSMVRLYDGPFIRALSLKSGDMGIMPEAVYKSILLGERIAEIPGRLDWERQLGVGSARISSLRVLRQVLSTLLSGFFFRPFLFLVLPGCMIGAIAMYSDYWSLRHFIDALMELREQTGQFTFSVAFASAYAEHPHTFVMGMLFSMLSLQFIGMGMLAFQNKRYFEELYHLGSTRYRALPVRTRPEGSPTGISPSTDREKRTLRSHSTTDS